MRRLRSDYETESRILDDIDRYKSWEAEYNKHCEIMEAKRQQAVEKQERCCLRATELAKEALTPGKEREESLVLWRKFSFDPSIGRGC